MYGWLVFKLMNSSEEEMVTSTEAGEAAYEKTIISPTPLDPAIAAEILKEVKRIFDDQGIVFWLGSGTCLGCIRENRFIPWDDEMDTASVIGMHGLDEKTVYRIAKVFKQYGFYPRIRNYPVARQVSVPGAGSFCKGARYGYMEKALTVVEPGPREPVKGRGISRC